ncbi:transposase [Streptomyces roseochromogenus]|uniref:Putative transposase n=1 Tax=Streptomyces roseochromogenus subsp. oscitans TaxID=149682 RepID=Q8GHD2_STRRC|nr:transposase [Streptomyces roseochromogenus]AAN65219.1 putative transposase [Streptomyces roseochromogenus subsp. oscitans DS 12.976]
MRGRGGRPEVYCHPAMPDAIRSLVDNGIKWRAMPADFLPWDRMYAFFRRWRDHGLSPRPDPNAGASTAASRSPNFAIL